jgi:glycosyltransferase involved in cell wall biosynthesis
VTTSVRASIVIRTLNEARHLPDALAAIARQTLTLGCEVVVVDSGSTDGTPAIAAAAGCRVVQIRREEFSFGRSLNIGCDAARGRVFVFVSGHCVPASAEWLEKLIHPIESGDATITYGRQLGGPSTRFSERQIFAKYFPAAAGTRASGFFCNNANAAVRAEAWRARRFNEQLTGLEDLELARRVVEAGGVVQYVPSAAVFHHHDETWSQVTRRFEREALALQTIMPEIHLGGLTALRYFVAASLGDWRRAAAERVLLRNLWPVAAYRFCQYAGSWKGNHSHRQMSRELRERYFYPHVQPTSTDCAPAAQGTQREGARQELPAVRGQAPREAHAGYPARD